MALEIRHLNFSYGERSILKDLNATICRGRLTAIAGPNGVGKTTFLKCLARIQTPDSGTISFEGRDITKASIKEMAKMQAYVPQNTSLSFALTVQEYISLGRRPYVEWSFSEEDTQIIEENIAYLDLDRFRNNMLDELSGGERQKVILARALVQQPQIMLLDEPTSALDVKHQLEVMRILDTIAKERDCAIAMVVHDLSLIERYADDTILMSDGQIISQGSTHETLTLENIEMAYGVKALIIDTEHGKAVLPYE